MIDSASNLAIIDDESSLLRRLISKIAPVKRDELLTVAILTLNVFVLLTCYYVLKVLREPLILLGGGAELKAYASAGQTLLLLGVIPAFGWLSSKVSRVRLLTTMQVIFIGCLVAFYALAQLRAPIGLAFYLWLGIFNVLVVSNFWSFANDLYTEEQGKRLFAIIGIGASVGAIVGAFVPHLLDRVLGVYSLMLVAAGGLGVSIVLYRIADLRERSRTARGAPPGTAEKPEAMSRKGGFTLVIKDRYLRLLAVMLLVATIINTTGEYVIGKLATERSKQYAPEVAPAAAEPGTATQPDASKPDTAKSDAKSNAGASSKPAGKHASVDSAQGRYLEHFYSDYYGLVNLLSF